MCTNIPTEDLCVREKANIRAVEYSWTSAQNGLDCSLLIPLSQHVPMLKYYSVGLV